MPLLSSTVAAPQLSIVVPTYNESQNVPLLIAKIKEALSDCHDAWEIIFVDDDSKDGTAEIIRAIACDDPRVRCLLRIRRRGLSGACIEGMLASNAPFIAVLDADCQHDLTRLPMMLDILKKGEAQLVVGTRYMNSNNINGFSRVRLLGSRLSNIFVQRVLSVSLTDPMSGFFMIRRDQLTLLVRRLSTQGFKILLDIVATAHGQLRIVEIPYTFGQRVHGESKLDTMMVMDFIGLLIAKCTRDMVPVRFFFFLLVGGIGLIVHLIVLHFELSVLNMHFTEAQVFATFFAIIFNFFVNNQFTYRSQRLKGLKKLLHGLVKAYAIWSIGALANIAVAVLFYQQFPIWWIAASVGIAMGAIWNYVMSMVFIWRAR